MSPALDEAQSKWLEQVAAMRAAIANLKLPDNNEQGEKYGQDIDVDDEDFSGTASGEDIWDVISDEWEDEYSSDQLDGDVLEATTAGPAYGSEWLARRCTEVAQRGSGLDSQSLQEHVSAVLASDSNGRELYDT